jgi:hypothetical protein
VAKGSFIREIREIRPRLWRTQLCCSNLQFLCLRLYRRASFVFSRVPLRPSNALFLRVLRLLAAIQSKCLSMNHLQPKLSVAKSGPIKPNQA